MKNNNIILIGGAVLGTAALAYFLIKKIRGQQESDIYTPQIPNISNPPIKETPSVLDDMPKIDVVFPDNQTETLQNGNSLAQRANNPGALFWDGSTDWQGLDKSKTKSGQIIYFIDVDKGVRAQCMVLKSYKKKHGINTLAKVFERYAPKGHGDNDPSVYAKIVADKMRIGVNDIIDLDGNRTLLAGVAYHIHGVEAGYYWVPRSLFISWANKV